MAHTVTKLWDSQVQTLASPLSCVNLNYFDEKQKY